MSYDAVKAYFSIHMTGISKSKRTHVPAFQSHTLSNQINAALVHVSTDPRAGPYKKATHLQAA